MDFLEAFWLILICLYCTHSIEILDWYARQEEILTHNYNRFMEEDSFMKSVNQFLEVYDRVVG